LAAADIDKDNNKSTNGNDRRFILAGEDAITEENGELVIRFELRPDVEKRRQEALNAQATKTILEAHAASAWLFALGRSKSLRGRSKPHSSCKAPEGLHCPKYLRLLHP
jgi:uncharacterized heparinase superfamily protein